jgi:hypothetical protein
MSNELYEFDKIERNARVVLKALLMGVPVEFSGRHLVLDANGDLCQPAKNGKSEDVLLKLDPSLKWFLHAMEKMSDDEFTLIAANVGLNEIKQNKPA